MIKVLYNYALNYKALKHMKQKLIDLQRGSKMAE